MAKKKRKKANTGKLILVFIILVTVLTGGYLWLRKDPKVTKPAVNKPIKKLKIIDEDSKERPIAVMINNHPTARKYHAGLNDAYVVYEAIVEGGLTRLMALYKDQTTAKIGSVRSSRPYFLDYALEHDAVYVHYGWSDQARRDIESLGVNNINGLYEGSTFFRDTSLKVAKEHTAFTSIEKIKATIDKKGYAKTSSQKTPLPYSVDEIHLKPTEKEDGTKEPSDSLEANVISVPYSASVVTSYEYDPEHKVYKRFVNGTMHVDYITKNQYTAKNIIIMKVTNHSVDSYGRQALDTVGTGEGYYITNGYARKIKWSKNSRKAKTNFTYMDGKSVKINDGNTYIQIEPEYKKTTISA